MSVGVVRVGLKGEVCTMCGESVEGKRVIVSTSNKNVIVCFDCIGRTFEIINRR